MLLFWIVFGVRSIDHEFQGGTFHCDECGDQEYARHEVRSFFHIFLIPLIPLGKHDEYLECRGCGGYYKTWALAERPPTYSQAPDETDDTYARKLDAELDRT